MNNDACSVFDFGNPKQQGFIEWVKSHPHPRLHELLDKGMIEKKGLEFGSFPFDTERSAQVFFDRLFGERSETTKELGSQAFQNSRKFLSKFMD